ncbi:SGNH/GDSL hydrolase family protein [Microcella humidisoli]|uniref:SGNH/GDSL hydrolase family protein n=1 Tax=Microcella humidisoli TaxID=2963406 RepID=A0ABY5FY22_9MICO|nr:SGNH/GDSL hydrolase family protein [Microcella humidisoli]UTT63163.1 SGNH/GDSL hydrolase family protein [Microcella humidisoli]
MPITSYAAIGDSYTEGMGDERPDGTPRGWADLVAAGLAHAAGGTIGYANLAIRGRLLAPILDEQLPAALALGPQLLSINGGGNDILRPSVSIEAVADRLVSAAERARATGAHVMIVSGGDPTRHIPLGRVFSRRGDALAVAARHRLVGTDVLFVDNWSDPQLPELRHWSVDRLHLNAQGHALAAANVLAALGVAIAPAPTAPDAADDVERPRTAEYWRRYVLPWIGRRLTGRSSGDHRRAKRPALEPFGPEQL